MRDRATALSAKASMWKPNFDASVLKPVWISGEVPSSSGEGSPACHLYALPVEGAVPVFLMEDSATGKRFASLDPHVGVRSAPFPNPLPESNSDHALYNDRAVFYPYEAKCLPTGLLGYASVKEVAGTTRVELPGPAGKTITVWAPGSPVLK